jgi:hypothetical protein
MRRRMQMIFQDPLSSLDPRQNVESILTEGLAAHGIGADRAARRDIVCETLVEQASSLDLYRKPLHPYTKALMVGRAGARSGRRGAPRTHPAVGRPAVAGKPAVRLPLPDPVPVGPGALRERTAGAAHDRRCFRGPHGRVPLRGGDPVDLAIAEKRTASMATRRLR